MRAPKSAARVVLAGAATLFVELALIRYVPGQVRVLAYFTNFVLLAAFLGFGVGMLALRRWPQVRWIAWLAPAALLLAVAFAHLADLLHVVRAREDFIFLEYRRPGTQVSIYAFLAASYVLLAAAFVPLGHTVGQTLSGDRPLGRYGLNIVGSLLGIAAFVPLSALALPPWIWILAAGVLSGVCLFGAPRGWVVGGAACVLVATVWTWQASGDSIWSPYQKITVGPVSYDPARGVVHEWELPRLSALERARLQTLPLSDGFIVRVNDDAYQHPLDLRDAAIARHPALVAMRRQYDAPFQLGARPRRVLVVGAGTGNDVAAALRAGCSQVDAVEIDPEILRLGAFHPERPYGDPRVRAFAEDARGFLARTDRTYDLIVYGQLDSHVLLSQHSNVRLDSYVFTRESFALARTRLAPGGILVVSHAVDHSWFVRRMVATLTAAFGRPPVVVSQWIQHPMGVIYASGERVPAGRPVAADTRILDDDWPFVYLQDNAVPGQYLLAMAIMALTSLLAVRFLAGPRWQGTDPHFFALGAGFLLLETRGVGVLALLLGSTWVVTSAVFVGVLVMALLATAAGARRAVSGGAPWVFYGLLAGALALNLVFPLGALASLPLALRVPAGAALVSLPLFASGVVFALSLVRTGSADRALASNLLGALTGGLAEYASMVSGFRFLLVIAALFYLLAFALDLRARREASSRAAAGAGSSGPTPAAA